MKFLFNQFQTNCKIPKNEIWFVKDSQITGKITNIGDEMDILNQICNCGHQYQMHQLVGLNDRGRCLHQMSNKTKCDCLQFTKMMDFQFVDVNETMGYKRNGSPEFYKLLQEMAEIHDSKSHDYANNENPFGNYQFAGALSKLFDNADDAGFIGRIGEKLYRLANLENSSKTGETKIPKNESIEDTERDLPTIMALWIAMRRNRRSKQSKQDIGGMSNQMNLNSARPSFRGDVEDGITEEIKKDNSAYKITNYEFHRDLQQLLNRYSIDTEMNMSDVTIASMIIHQLLKTRNQTN